MKPEVILEATSRMCNASVRQLKGKNRRRDYAWPRQTCVYLIRQHNPKISLQSIGALIGNRDHTTIMHSLSRVKERLASPEWSQEERFLHSEIMREAREIERSDPAVFKTRRFDEDPMFVRAAK